jgi:hypothetical protein
MSILISLKNVQEIIIQIESILKDIHNKTNYNERILLLKNLRSYTFADELKNLEILIQVLEKRRDNLFKTLEVFKHCERKVPVPDTHLLMYSEDKEEVNVNELM